MNRPQRSLIILLAAALAAVLVACGQGTAPPNSVTKVTVSPATMSLSVGGTGALNATVTTNGTADLGVTWSSADTSVATVNASGVVTGVATGSTTVTATSKHDASKKGSAQVTVTGGSSGEAPFLWSVSFGSDGDDSPNAMAINSLGNVVLAGYTAGDLGGANQGGQDGFVGTFTSEGAEIWLVQFGTSEDDTVQGVVVDGNDDIYVVGSTYGALEGTNAGQRDAFVRKYSADGDVVWTEQFGTSVTDSGSGIVMDGDGNLYVRGSTSTPTGVSSFVRKFEQTPGGLGIAEVWAAELEGSLHGMVGTADGSIVGAGAFVTADRESEAYVYKLDPDGDVVWTSDFGTGLRPAPGGERNEVPATRRPLELWEALVGYSERGMDVTLDEAGNVYLVGYAGAVPVSAGVGVSDTRPFVAKVPPAGTEEWAVLLDADHHAYASNITADLNGDLVVTGGTLVHLGYFPTPPGTELLVWKLSPLGNVLWKDVFGTSGWDSQTDVVTTADGSVYTTGFQYGELGKDNPDGSDAFLRKYGP